MTLLEVTHLVGGTHSWFKLSLMDFKVPFSSGHYLFPRVTNMRLPSSVFAVKEDAASLMWRSETWHHIWFYHLVAMWFPILNCKIGLIISTPGLWWWWINYMRKNWGNQCLSYYVCVCVLFIYFIIIFWLHWVLVVACGVFVVARGLFVLVRGLLSSCGARAPGCVGSVVVVCGVQSVWAL